MTNGKIENKKEMIHNFFIKESKKISEICDSLERGFEKSKIAIKHPNLLEFFNVDEKKSKIHYDLTRLYNLIININYNYQESYEDYLRKNTTKLIGKTDKGILKFKTNYLDNLNKIQEAKNLISILNLPHTLEDLVSDFKKSRVMLKKLFKNIFEEYNINFTATAINLLFDKLKYEDKNNFDAIELLTYETRFCGGLSSQFSFGKSMDYAAGIFSIFFMRSCGLLSSNSNFKMTDKESKVQSNVFINNPFMHEKSVIEIFAKAILLADKIDKKNFSRNNKIDCLLVSINLKRIRLQ